MVKVNKILGEILYYTLPKHVAAILKNIENAWNDIVSLLTLWGSKGEIENGKHELWRKWEMLVAKWKMFWY